MAIPDFSMRENPALIQAILNSPAQIEQSQAQKQQMRQQRLSSFLNTLSTGAQVARQIQDMKAQSLAMQQKQSEMAGQDRVAQILASKDAALAGPLLPGQQRTTYGNSPGYEGDLQGAVAKANPSALTTALATSYSTPKSFDQIIARKVDNGEITLQEAAKLKSDLNPPSAPSYYMGGTNAAGQPVFYNSKDPSDVRVGSVPGGGPILPKAETGKMADETRVVKSFGDTINEVETLLAKVPAGFEGGLSSFKSKFTGGLLDPDTKTYMDTLPAAAVQIYRGTTGDTRLSDQDAASRAYPLLPMPYESAKVRANKIALLKNKKELRLKLLNAGSSTKVEQPSRVTVANFTVTP